MRTRLNDSVREQGSAFVVKFAMAEDRDLTERRKPMRVWWLLTDIRTRLFLDILDARYPES